MCCKKIKGSTNWLALKGGVEVERERERDKRATRTTTGIEKSQIDGNVQHSCSSLRICIKASLQKSILNLIFWSRQTPGQSSLLSCIIKLELRNLTILKNPHPHVHEKYIQMIISALPKRESTSSLRPKTAPRLIVLIVKMVS